MDLFAVEHIRPMRGGSHAHLMRCSDDAYYIVKFQNNDQGTRTLANDLFGSLLAKRMGLPVADVAVVDVPEDLVKLTEELTVGSIRNRRPCQAGKSFGSRYVCTGPFKKNADPEHHEIWLKEGELRAVRNLSDFVGTLVFDIWTYNEDTRQFVFTRHPEDSSWTATMIDQGMCFGGPGWHFPRYPYNHLYHSVAYESITGIKGFEPWLSRLENEINATVLKDAAQEIPPEWYGTNPEEIRSLLKTLNRRRAIVRHHLWEIWESSRVAFPSWPKRSYGAHG